MLEHPVVVEELREVRAARVGQDRRAPARRRRGRARSRARPRPSSRTSRRRAAPPRARAGARRGTSRGRRRAPTRRRRRGPSSRARCPCRSPRRGTGADRSSRLRRVDRALGVDADDLHLRLALLEVAADAADRAAGTDRDHDRVELAAGLLPDLGAGRAVVRLGVRHVRVLVRLEPAGDLLGEPRRDGVVRLGRVVLDRRRRDHDLGAVAAQHRDLLLAHLVGHHEDAAVALLRRRDREPDAGVARGRLDDRAARLELPVALGGLDHREPDPVLVRAARVQELELREDRPGHVARDPVEPDDRRVADQVEHGRVLARHGRRKRTRRYAGVTAPSGAVASSSRRISTSVAIRPTTEIPTVTQNASWQPRVNARGRTGSPWLRSRSASGAPTSRPRRRSRRRSAAPC